MILFLDDYRKPDDVPSHLRPNWFTKEAIQNYPIITVTSYKSFVKFVTEYYKNTNHLPDHISFDHDLVPGHYHKNMQEGEINYKSEDFDNDDNKTGYHCAEFLIDFCKELGLKLPLWNCHSFNPIGRKNIIKLLSENE